jgi:protein SCO1/2
MKKIIKVGLILGMSTLFFASCGSEAKSTSPADSEISTVKYQCPMKCEGDVVYDEEGMCPVCKMDLKAVK